jgi:hypothetical protein
MAKILKSFLQKLDKNIMLLIKVIENKCFVEIPSENKAFENL